MGETKKQLVVQLIQVNQHQIFDPTVAAALRYVWSKSVMLVLMKEIVFF